MSDSGSRTGLEIAVVGMAGRFPGAQNLDQFWRNLRGGTESVRFFTDEELLAAGVEPEVLRHPHYVKARAILDGADAFDATLFGYSPREAAVLDPQHRLLLECSWEALETAGQSPASFPGPIGLFAGVGQSWYFVQNILPNRELMRSLGIFQSLIGSGNDFLTTRASYKLQLTGPSVNVQTACSTSLVAIHLASQSLLSGECDMALAGGVSVRVPRERGYLYQEGGIASRDGHCRAFDARASGTVNGDGVGIVVLRRLEDALADGNLIRAVIRGSAVNNDGGYRVGYTAPSAQGQARVIRTALAAGGVPPETVTYVETHGAATPIGDPTEVSALTEGFRNGTGSGGTERSCAIGSVKTNIGHVDSAAGVAGFIKTVLALENAELPPSLHFEDPHPEIDFDSGPFYVNTALCDWRSDGAPRRAGVSSFGLGGTNAHVVLEEPPEADAGGPSRPWQLLVFSGATETAADGAMSRLAAHLREHPELDLADVAHTLQVGRQPLAHRRMLVERSPEEAATALERRDPKRVFLSSRSDGRREVTFLLPGLGEHYPEMGRDLYDAEPSFRRHLDRCAELLLPRLDVDLRELLYPPRTNPEEPRPASTQPDLKALLGRSEKKTAALPSKLDQTRFAHPAIFAVSYALSQVWKEWGVFPRAMIGYSLGEYLAACLGGVFSLEDALLLVSERARLISELPAGGMLAVALGQEEVSSLLGPELAVAATNAPHLSVVSGPDDALSDLDERLVEQGFSSRRLNASHAFHSGMMEPVVPQFREVLGRVRFHRLEVPFLSNVTGTWVREEEVVQPEYWLRHLRGTVRFSEALTELLRDPGTALLEVGPGRTLGTFARQHADADRARLVLSSLRPQDEAVSDVAHLLRSLGRLWLAGVDVEWHGLARHERRRRVLLPTYPFERSRHWIEATASLEGAIPAPPPGQATPGDPGTAEALTPVDVRANLQSEFVAPSDEIEEAVVAIWQRLLGVEQIGVHDNFFELGGHSLLATQVVESFRNTFGVEVPLRALTDAPTPAELAVAIRHRQQTAPQSAPVAALPKIEPDPENLHEPFPLTDVQEAYWVGRQGVLELGNVATHTYVEQDREGFDLERYRLAWRRLIERHGMLRAIFLPEGAQKILETVPPFEIPVLDLRDEDEETVAAELQAVRHRMSHQVLPADQWPLFEIRATLLEGNRVRLHASFDFLIFDAWSADILNAELEILYQNPDASLSPLELSFRDYVLAEVALGETELYRRSKDYWRDRLDTLPPAPDLPLAKAPSEISKPRFVSRRDTLDRAAWDRLKQLAKRRGLTPTGLVVAIFSEILALWSQRPEFTLNLTLFNRLPMHPQVNDILGDFSSLGLLAVDGRAGRTFEERARAVQLQLWDDLDRRYYSGVRVMRDLGRQRGSLSNAMMPVVLTSTLGFLPYEERPDDPAAPVEDVYQISQTPQVWLDHQVIEVSGKLVFNWDAVDELFPTGLLDDMFSAFAHLLGRLADDEEAWAQERFDLLPAGQLERRAQVNATEVPVPEELLQAPFEERARSAPDRVAVVAPGRTLSYAAVDRAANRLTHRLREGGSEPGSLVAVVMEKGWEQVVAVLAVLRSGAAYLPVDPGLPRERLHHLLQHAEAHLALTTGGLLESPEWPGELTVLQVGDEDLRGGAKPPTPPAPDRSPGDLAYVIYTSGSTGLPKGVMIPHKGALNTIADVNRRFEVGPSDRVLALSSLSFDLSVYDVFGLLAAGGTIVLPPASASRDPDAWRQLVSQERVTLWNSVPALLQMMVEHVETVGGADLETLRLCLLSGDWIPLSLPDRARTLAPEARTISLGGATEASIWSIFHPIEQVDPRWNSIPYGRPLANQRFEVLNDVFSPCPTWVPGELFISGTGVAQGYWRDVERTVESFFPHPSTGERLYRTGDRGRYLPDGTIEFLGREDLQVKVQGYRIELGEIEAALAQHDGVAAAVAAAVGDDPTDRRLAAYVVPATGGTLQTGELRDFLGRKLPSYMVPVSFTFLDRLPLSTNGKVDRSALPRPAEPARGAAGEAVTAAPSRLGARVLRVVAEAFKLDEVDPDDGFFDLGATSIEIIRLATLLQTEFGTHPEMEELFTLGDARGLIGFYERQETPPSAPASRKARTPDAVVDDRLPHLQFDVILDPERREEYKQQRFALRREDSSRPTVTLPAAPVDEAAVRSNGARRSIRRYGDWPVPLANLGEFLSCLRDLSDDGQPRHRYGSAGGLYPVELYLHVKPGRVEELESGIYRYHPVAHRLECVTQEAEIDRRAHGWENQAPFDQAAFSVFLVARMETIGPLYGRPALDYCLIEAGLICQLLETEAPGKDLGLCQIGIGGIALETIRPLLALEEDQVFVHSLIGGPLDPSLGEAAHTAPPMIDEWEEGTL